MKLNNLLPALNFTTSTTRRKKQEEKGGHLCFDSKKEIGRVWAMTMLIIRQGRHMLCHRLGDHPIHALHTRLLPNVQQPSMFVQFHL